jgi:hypothetical protein
VQKFVEKLFQTEPNKIQTGRHAPHARRAEPPARCAHAEAHLRPPVRAQCLSHCVKVQSTWPKALGRCHVPRPHALDGGAASHHWSDGRRTSPPIPSYPGHTTTLPRLLALVCKESTPTPRARIEKPSRLSSREHPSPATVAIAAAGEHLAPLAPVAS